MWTATSVLSAVALLLAVGSRRAPRKAAPANTSPPTISGTRAGRRDADRVERRLVRFEPDVVRVPLAALQLERQRAATTSAGATNQTYTLQKGDAGHRMRVSVTASNCRRVGQRGLGADRRGRRTGCSRRTRRRRRSAARRRQGSTLTASAGAWKQQPDLVRLPVAPLRHERAQLPRRRPAQEHVRALGPPTSARRSASR